MIQALTNGPFINLYARNLHHSLM